MQPSIRSVGLLALTVALLAGLSSRPARAADGDLDSTFGSAGQVMTDLANSTDIANAVALQADGKIVVVGTTYRNNDYSNEDFAVVRYNANGTLDTTFGVNGKVTTDFPGLAAVASSVVVQPDGKILVAGGAFPLFTFLGDIKLVRYNANGSLDTSFGSGGIVTTRFAGQGSYAFSVALQPDGKIVVGGTAFVNFSSDDSSNTDFAIARYNPNGTLDTTFGNGGKVATDFDGFNDDVYAVLVQPDGKIVAAGSAKNPTNFYDFGLARYLPNGTIDTTFGSGGKVRTDFGTRGYDQARSAVLQPDGKIVAAGFAISQNGGTWNFAVARLWHERRPRYGLQPRRQDADQFRQLLPAGQSRPSAARWQADRRRLPQQRIDGFRLRTGALESERLARFDVRRRRQGANLVRRSQWRCEWRRPSARRQDRRGRISSHQYPSVGRVRVGALRGQRRRRRFAHISRLAQDAWRCGHVRHRFAAQRCTGGGEPQHQWPPQAGLHVQ